MRTCNLVPLDLVLCAPPPSVCAKLHPPRLPPPLPSAVYCPQTVDWRTQTAEDFRASMNSMESSEALVEFLGSKGFEAVEDVLRRNRELEAMARVGVSLKRAIQQAQKQHSTTEGRRTWQTLVTAAAFRDDEEGDSKVSATRKAAAIGIQQQAFLFAVDRAKRLRTDLHPDEAIKGDVYWFWPRAKNSNAASDELVLLMRQYWHTDEVSRATGDSADRDMWKASKSPTAERHPRRQLIEVGGGDAVYAKFLKWADYKSFKGRQKPGFTDPGRMLFLSTRCKCLILPVMEQSECEIHSQQVLYIEALANVDLETIMLDTGVAPVPVNESEVKKEIIFKPRTTTCEMARVTGTQWQESDSEAASKLWEELGREEEPTLIARFGKRVRCLVWRACCNCSRKL